MADSELQDLTADTAPADGDIVYVVVDPSGTPLARKMTVNNLLKAINVLTADTTPDTADVMVTIDDPSGTPLAKKATIANLMKAWFLDSEGNPADVGTAADGTSTYAARRDHVHGPIDGWTSDSATWTYASASTFTVSGDVTAQFRKGTKLKLTQTSAKYFYVVGSSYGAPNTTVTVTGGTDYTLANAAITLPYYSYQAAPQGFPDWFNWTVSFTGFSVAPSVVASRFQVIAKTCLFTIVTNQGTSNAAGFTMTSPITAATVSGMKWNGPTGYIVNNGAGVAAGQWEIVSAGTAFTLYTSAGGAWAAANGKAAELSGFYEI